MNAAEKLPTVPYLSGRYDTDRGGTEEGAVQFKEQLSR